MSAALLPALQRNFLLFILAFVAASIAFGTVMLTSPPTSEAASSLTDYGFVSPAINCEFLPPGDVNNCTVYR